MLRIRRCDSIDNQEKLKKKGVLELGKYEGIFILKADLEEKELEGEYSKIENAIDNQEGKIEKSEKWGKRKLAYPIKKARDGFLLYLEFEALPKAIKPLTELFKLNGNILRTQIVKKGG